MQIKISKSRDTIQQALRDNKKGWNAAYKEFSQRLKAFKDALNGRGSSKYGLPPSDIKLPLPQELVGFLSELSSNYSQLAQEALRITQEQQHYSETRRKPTEQKIATASDQSAYVLLGETKLPTLLAITPEEQERGLMFQKNPQPMSFIYSKPSVNRFWMKNTPCDLDIIFSLEGKITNICRGEAYNTKLLGNWELSDLVVELPAGTCEKMGITVGTPVKLLHS